MMNILNLAQTLKTANNPEMFLQNYQPKSQQEQEIITKTLEMIKGKNPNEYMTIAQNLAQTQGRSLNQVQQEVMQRLGF